LTSVPDAIERLAIQTQAQKEATAMTNKAFPPGWDEARVQKVLAHYKAQSEEEAVAEDEAAGEASANTVMTVPKPLVPAVGELIAKHQRETGSGGR